LLDTTAAPIPPLEIDNVPDIALLKFELANGVLELVMYSLACTLKVPLNARPDNGKKFDNVDDNVVPFLYFSLQFIFPKTYNL
jgi:hypothetical protein